MDDGSRRSDEAKICVILTLKIHNSLRLNTFVFSLPQDVYHSHRPKEKLYPDSNNNENSVPKDFDTIDSNSNLGARSQRQRAPISNTKRKLDKAKAQSMLEKSANEILKIPPIPPKGLGHGHNRTFLPKRQALVPTIAAPVQGSNQDPPFVPEKKASTLLPPSLEAKKEQPQCEISGKEAISALSRARSRECRQQIVEVYCRHKERALMPEKVPRYCPLEGEFKRQTKSMGTILSIPNFC